MKPASRQAVAVLFRSLATSLAGGVPLVRALAMVGRSSSEVSIDLACQHLQIQVCQGRRLSQAMSQLPQVFSAFQVGLIRVGESSGHLDEVLEHIAIYEEKARDLALKFRSSLTYPLLVSAFALLLMLCSPPLVAKLLAPFLQDQAQEIPWLTRCYLGYCRLLCHPLTWVGVWLALVGGLEGYRFWSRDRLRRAKLWSVWLKAPALGPLLRNFATARFARALAIQLKVGIGPLQALPLAAKVSGDPVLQRDIPLAQKALIEGKTLVKSLRSTGYFSKPFLGILTAAEECGSLCEDFRRLAEFYEMELEASTSTFAALLEPVVMLALGLMAGLMIFAVTLPILKLVQAGL